MGRWVISPASCSAKIGTTVAAASVPATTTLCWPRASKISSVMLVAKRGVCLRSLAFTCVYMTRPGGAQLGRGGYRLSRSAIAGCVILGPVSDLHLVHGLGDCYGQGPVRAIWDLSLFLDVGSAVPDPSLEKPK